MNANPEVCRRVRDALKKSEQAFRAQRRRVTASANFETRAKGRNRPTGPMEGAQARPGKKIDWLNGGNCSAPVLNGNWIIKGVLPSHGLGVLYGRPGCGKSFFTLDMALHIASGLAWRELKTRNVGVSIVASEAGLTGSNRIFGWLGKFNRTWPVKFQMSPVTLNLGSTDADARALVSSIIASQPDCGLVIIDTLSRNMGGADENSGESMTKFIGHCDHIAKSLKCLVLLVHHSGKDAAKGSRGHSSLLGAVDLEIEILREDKSMPGLATVTKNRHGADGAEFGFTLVPEYLGLDEDGDEVTTAVAVETDVSEGKQKGLPGKVQRLIMDEYINFAIDHAVPNPPGTGWPEAGAVKVVNCDAFIDFVTAKRPGSRRNDTMRTINKMIDHGHFAMNENCIWKLK